MPLVLGPELLANGNFELSVGSGGASPAGPGWTTAYLNVPGDNNIFATGAQHYAYFTTNAGQVTANNPAATPLFVKGNRSLAVNVGPNTTVPIIEWANIPLVNGQTYRLTADAGIIFNPFSIAIRIDGGAQGNFPVAAPSTTSTWQTTTTDFTFAGPTGNYSVGLYSNSGVAAGNDLTFDNISLRTLDITAGTPIPCECCPIGQACLFTSNQFVGVAETTSFPGWTPTNLNLTIDGSTSGIPVAGYNSPAGAAVTPNVQVTYTIGARDGVRGLRLWNQGGGNLNDADGLGMFVADFYSGVTMLYSFETAGVNGGAAQNLLLPEGVILNGVDRVVLRELQKQTASNVAPLWRELQLLTSEPVFSCRMPDGTLVWHDEAGNVVNSADVVRC